MEAWETGTKARVRRFTERSTRDLDPCGLLGDAPRLWLSFKNPECLSRKPGLSRESKPGSSTDAGSGKEAEIGLETYRGLLARLVDILKERLGPSLVSVVLYGSVARGVARPDSDVDLLVVLDNPPSNYHRRLDLLLSAERTLQGEEVYRRVSKALGREPFFSYLVLSKREAGERRYIFLDMVDDAVVLYDPAGFFKRTIQDLQNRLKELGARRVWLEDGTWYWDIKPDLKPGEVFNL